MSRLSLKLITGIILTALLQQLMAGEIASPVATNEIKRIDLQNTTSSISKMSLRDGDVVLNPLEGQTPNVNFGGFTGEYFSQYYFLPADGVMYSLDLNFSDLPDRSGGYISLRIFSANYAWPEIDTESIADTYPDSWLGYYSEADTMDITGDNWIFGGINNLDGADPTFIYDPLDVQIWPASGAAVLDLQPNVNDQDTLHIELGDYSSGNLEFEQGQSIIIVVEFGGFDDLGDGADYRSGFYSRSIHTTPQPAMKFYDTNATPNGRTGNDDWGWHIRSYVWDWSVNVNLSSSPFLFFQLDDLPTTLSTEDRLVNVDISDQNPSGNDEFLESVSLGYRVDGVPFELIEMLGGNNVYSASIPGQDPGSEVEYWVEAIDIIGVHQFSEVKTYFIYTPTEPTLLVYDAEDNIGEEWRYMMGLDSSFSQHYNLWEASYGPISTELVNAYSTIYHVMAGSFGPQVYNISPVYYQWLENGTIDNEHCLLLSGQDYGVISGFADSTFSSSSFEGGYLGLDALGPQDINYDGTTASYEKAYAVQAVPNDPLTGFLAAYEDENLKLFYEPLRELGFPNWIDNMWPATGTACVTDTNHGEAAVALYNSEPGWKTSFWALDPLGLNYYDPADTSSAYISAVDAVGNPVVNIFEWFRGAITITSVDETEIPMTTRLHTSYPNPFNPVTSIAYELGVASDVNITVFNMLGQEVTTLVAGYQTAGAYSIQWGGSDHAGHPVSSGLYFYTMRAEGYSATQKMMMLK